MIEPCWAIQNPKGAFPMVGKFTSSQSRKRIPQPKLTKNQTESKLNTIRRHPFLYLFECSTFMLLFRQILNYRAILDCLSYRKSYPPARSQYSTIYIDNLISNLYVISICVLPINVLSKLIVLVSNLPLYVTRNHRRKKCYTNQPQTWGNHHIAQVSQEG